MVFTLGGFVLLSMPEEGRSRGGEEAVFCLGVWCGEDTLLSNSLHEMDVCRQFSLVPFTLRDTGVRDCVLPRPHAFGGIGGL